jgi:hypothetical protein
MAVDLFRRVPNCGRRKAAFCWMLEAGLAVAGAGDARYPLPDLRLQVAQARRPSRDGS